MIYLFYIGDHKNDVWTVRAGWKLTRFFQKGRFKEVTHSECVLEGSNYKECTIASSSVRDGGVRTKRKVALNKNNWVAYRVDKFEASVAIVWFIAHNGEPYSLFGAAGTVVTPLRLIARYIRGWFCNWSCVAAFIPNGYRHTPSECLEYLIANHGAVDDTLAFFSD